MLSQHTDQQNKTSLLSNSQNNQVPIHELSGDENFSKSVLLSDIRTEKASFFLTVMTIMKTVIGVGILGLPSVFYHLGWALGIIVFTITTIGNQYSCTLLLKAKNLSHKSNFSTIGYFLTNGKAILALLYMIVIVNNFGVCTAQLTIFKEIIRNFAQYIFHNEDEWYMQSYFTVGVIMAILLLPLVMLRKIQKLRFLALIGIAAISLFVITVFINFFYIMTRRDWELGKGISAFPKQGAWSALASIPNILLALLYQMNFFPIYKGMKNSSDKKMLSASLIGTLSCFIIYLIVGLLGYLVYGEILATSSNYLLALKNKDAFPIPTWLYCVMNLTFLCSVFCSYPIIFFGARNNLIAFAKLFQFNVKQSLVQQTQDNLQEISEYVVTPNKNKKKLIAQVLFYSLTLILFVAIFSVAITVGSLGPIFNLVGAISANSLGFILPSFFYCSLIIRLNKKRTINFYLSAIVFIISLPFGVLAIVAEFIQSEH